jgi:hypothetical protein
MDWENNYDTFEVVIWQHLKLHIQDERINKGHMIRHINIK